MELLLQRVVDGLSDGAIYALFALAVVLVYRCTGFINFAQGEMATLTAFVAWFLWSPDDGGGLPLGIAILLAVAAAFVFGAAVERVVMRPFSGGDHLRMAIVTMGLLLVVGAVTAWTFGTTTRRLPSIFPPGGATFVGASISYSTLGILALLAAVSSLLYILFVRTTLGVTLRASSLNGESSSLLGIDVNRNLMIGWGLAASLGGLAAIMIAPSLYLSTTLMGNVMLYGFTAAVVGGLDSSVGAVVGGLMVGLIQSLASGYVPFIGTQLQLATALVVVVAILVARPQGIFGRTRLVRV